MKVSAPRRQNEGKDETADGCSEQNYGECLNSDPCSACGKKLCISSTQSGSSSHCFIYGGHHGE
ncbi:hypothetical protein AA0313_1836 [Acetobacter indonesiensis NRIC 0313]|nr:hypothetical protein AA0313_1836 [Acetobacter indonesiensis NRIC 0313]